jgi:hypothetical protein
MEKCGAKVLVLRRLVREKILIAEGRQNLVYNFLIAYSAEQSQVLCGSIFPSSPMIELTMNLLYFIINKQINIGGIYGIRR